MKNVSNTRRGLHLFSRLSALKRLYAGTPLKPNIHIKSQNYMNRMRRILSGRHAPQEIRWHLTVLAVVYWGLVFCAWLGYSGERAFSITSHMLSALGSYDARHNPNWFWVFSVAMIYCGLVMIPVMIYVYRRFAAISRWGASIGAFFFLAGCVGLILTGLFPYARGTVFGVWDLRHVHGGVAGTMGAAFVIGFLWHGLLLLKDMFSERRLVAAGKTSYLRFAGPYLACSPVFIIAATRIQWESIHAALQAAANASAREAAAAMDAALSGFRHFPLLEHLAIWALTIYVIWFTIALPHRTGQPELSGDIQTGLEEDAENVRG